MYYMCFSHTADIPVYRITAYDLDRYSGRYHSKCAHTILYHSFRLRWSLLLGRFYVGLSTTSVLNYWTICSQNHWLLDNPTYTGYQPIWILQRILSLVSQNGFVHK